MIDEILSINYLNQLCEAFILGIHVRRSFQRRQHQEQVSHSNLYTSMCVVRFIHIFWINNSCFLFTI